MTSKKDEKRTAYETVSKADFRRLQRRIAAIVGVLGLGLPALLFFAQWYLGYDRDDQFKDVCFHQSLSHFYYAPFFGTLFVGSLTIIAVLLFLWRGESWHERLAAMAAAVFLLGVAYFPTKGVGCIEPTFDVLAFVRFGDPSLGDPILPEFKLFDFEIGPFNLHHLSTIGTFFTMLYVVVILFKRKDARHFYEGVPNLGLRVEKRVRNIIYDFCGALMLMSAAALTYTFFLEAPDLKAWNAWRGTFWFEASFIVAFSLAWLTKGRFFDWLFVDTFEKEATDS